MAMAGPHGEQLSPDSVRHKDFMQVLLSFQMNLTEAFLADFVKIFRQVNTEGTGVVAGEQLEELVRRVSFVQAVEDGTVSGRILVQAKANTLNSIRPFKKGATFSQCVDLFTALISARWDVVGQEDETLAPT